MSCHCLNQEQDQNISKLVMSAFYKIVDKDGATADKVTQYLQNKFGDVWKASTLTWKVEETLNRSAELGFLERQGNKYKTNLPSCWGQAKRRKKKPCKRCLKKKPRPCY